MWRSPIFRGTDIPVPPSRPELVLKRGMAWLQKTRLNAMTNREWIAQFQREQLHHAAEAGDLPRVQKLLAAKYPVNRFDDLGKTPLHYAVAGEHFAVVDALLLAGAHVNAHDERRIGETPLGDCAGSCSYEMAKRLVEAGADPTIPGWMMLTAIDRASERKRPDGKATLRLLLEAAARKASPHGLPPCLSRYLLPGGRTA